MSHPALQEKSAQSQVGRSTRRPVVHLALVLGTAGLIAGSSWFMPGRSEGQKAEVRDQKSEARSQRSGARGQESAGLLQPSTTVISGNGQRTTDNGPAETSDERFRDALLGTWYLDDYYGRCILDIREGGKGTMVVVFGSYYAYLLADRVDAVLEWTIEDGRALLKTISGKPEAAYAIIAREKGEDRDRKIIEIGERQMVLEDDRDDGSVANWTRAKSLAEAVKVK